MPSLQTAPEFFEHSKYANPTNVVNSPFQIAFKTELPAFIWLQGSPDLVADFSLWTTAVHNGQMTWLDVIDFTELIHGSTVETPVFVDVGGGLGSQCALLKHKHPDLTGRVILQALPVAIDHSLSIPPCGESRI